MAKTLARVVVAALAASVVITALAATVLGSNEKASTAPTVTRTGGWVTLSPSPLKRSEVGAAIVDGQLYVVGGFEVGWGKSSAQMVRYDIATDQWRKVRPLPIVVNHPAVTAYRGHLYLLGGWTDGALSDRLYRYDPGRNRWRLLPDAPTARAALALAGIGGRLYAAGGATAKTGQFRGLEIYDLKRRRWRTGPPMPTGRNHVAAAVFKGGFVVTGGRTDTPGTDDPVTDLDVVERYDPDHHRWYRMPSLTVPRSGHAAATVRGMIAVFGGEQLPGTLVGNRDIEQLEWVADAEVFDPRVGDWSPLPSMPTARSGLGGAAFDGRVFAVAGHPSSDVPSGILEALRVTR